MKRKALVFSAPGEVGLVDQELDRLASDQVLVRSEISAISAGTELLIYRGEAPQALAADESLPSLKGTLEFPLQYGYATVGTIVQVGEEVSKDWIEKRVFAFQPHTSHFITHPEELIKLEDGLHPDRAVLLPTMETAVSLLHDGKPLLGERVAVFGQGPVGLLTTWLLAQLPLADLIAFDKEVMRREAARGFGAQQVLKPTDLEQIGEIDLSFELTGNPAALDQAIAVTGFEGRVVIGSWYGNKRSEIDLGGSFHRGRIKLISSQVSALPSELKGRWTKRRRLQFALEQLAALPMSDLVTHRIPFDQAGEAYRLLDQHFDQVIQVLLEH